MTKTDIINNLIKKYGYTSYLEIGLDTGIEYSKIVCKNKESVDPYIQKDHDIYDMRFNGELPENIKVLLTYRMTSDEFFAQNEKRYDIILVDGLHEQQQVARDIINSLNILTDNGTIVVHDCLPGNERMQVVPRISAGWNGDVWKGVAELMKQGLVMNVVDTDWGVGIIRKKDNKGIHIHLPEKSELTWRDFRENRNMLMHVISEQEFVSKYMDTDDRD